MQIEISLISLLVLLVQTMLFSSLLIATGAVIKRVFYVRFNIFDDFFSILIYGIAFWIYYLFALNVLQAFIPWIIWFTIIVIISIFMGFYFKDDWFSQFRILKQKFKLLFVWQNSYLIIFFIVLGLLFIACSFPFVSWDAGVYHLTVPKLFIKHGGFYRIPYNVYSNWPLNIEMLYSLAMILKDHIFAKMVHFMFGIMLLSLLYKIAHTYFNRCVSMLSISLFFSNDVVINEFSRAYVELAYTFFFISAFWFLDKYKKSFQRSDLVLFGLTLALMAGSKVNGFLGCISLLVLLMVPELLSKKSYLSLKDLVFIMILFLVFFIPWIIKTYILTGNPFYPFLFQYFGGPEWSGDLEKQFLSWQNSITFKWNLKSLIALPSNIINNNVTISAFSESLSKVWLVLPLSLFYLFKNRYLRIMSLLSLIYVFLWLNTSMQVRFLIPVLPFMSILLSGSLFLLLKSFMKDHSFEKYKEIIFLTISVIVLIFNTSPHIYDYVIKIKKVMIGHNGKINPVPLEIQYLNDNVTDSNNVLFVNTNQTFFYDGKSIKDSFFEASQVNDFLKSYSTLKALEDVFKAKNISHIVLDNKNWGIQYPLLFFKYLDKQKELHFDSLNSMRVFEVRP